MSENHRGDFFDLHCMLVVSLGGSLGLVMFSFVSISQ